jgi:hypothetical protein
MQRIFFGIMFLGVTALGFVLLVLLGEMIAE